MAEQPSLYFGTACTSAPALQLAMLRYQCLQLQVGQTQPRGPRGSLRAFPQHRSTYKQTDGDDVYSCSADIPKPNEPYLSPLPKPFSILGRQSSDREEVGRANSVSLVFTHLVPASFKVAIKIYITRLRSLRKLMPRTTYIWHPAEKRNCLCFILIVCSPHHPKDLSLCPS